MKIEEEKEEEKEEEIRGYIWLGQLSLLQTVSMFRLVAWIFARGVTWVCDVYACKTRGV